MVGGRAARRRLPDGAPSHAATALKAHSRVPSWKFALWKPSSDAKVRGCNISASGRIIAGNGLNESNQPEAWILSLPEPGAETLAILALACLAMLQRSRALPPAL